MSKITKKMYEDFNKTKKQIETTKYNHKKNEDKIIDAIKPLVVERRKAGDGIGNWKITGVEFRNDSEIDYEYRKDNDKYEYVEISESEYDQLYKQSNKMQYFGKPRGFNEELICDHIFEPEYKEIYKKRIEKQYKYLRVYVYESWRYGGEDWIQYDFLLSEVMDNVLLRKDKLLKLKEVSNEL